MTFVDSLGPITIANTGLLGALAIWFFTYRFGRFEPWPDRLALVGLAPSHRAGRLLLGSQGRSRLVARGRLAEPLWRSDRAGWRFAGLAMALWGLALTTGALLVGFGIGS